MEKKKNMFCCSSKTIFLVLILLIGNFQSIYCVLSPAAIKAIGRANNNHHLEVTIKGLTEPRVVGTAGHANAEQLIVKELEALDYYVEFDTFNANVPILNNVTFNNIIGKLNPDANEFLMLSCHYDSKYYPDMAFQGATDSAVPCAIMLNIAKTMEVELAKLKSRTDISLMLVFFDGEEAIEKWTDTDSLYGSRHLAELWQPQLDRINVMVLLDLIGAANSKFYSFYDNTERLHTRLVAIERLLAKEQIIRRGKPIFLPAKMDATIQDDHIPFVERNVPALHLIPVPFPKVWHTFDDNHLSLDGNTYRRFNQVMRVFTLEFLTSFNSNVNFRQ